MKKAIVIFLLVAAAVCLVAYRPILRMVYGEHDISIYSIRLQSDTKSEIPFGENALHLDANTTYVLSVSVKNLRENEFVFSPDLKIKSSDNSILEVSKEENGSIILKTGKTGDCKLSLSYRGSKTTISVSVDRQVYSIKLDRTMFDITLGQTYLFEDDLGISLTPDDRHLNDLNFAIYSSDDVGNTVNYDYVDFVYDESNTPKGIKVVGIGEAFLRISAKANPEVYEDFKMRSTLDNEEIERAAAAFFQQEGKTTFTSAEIKSITTLEIFRTEIRRPIVLSAFTGLKNLELGQISNLTSFDFSILPNLESFIAANCSFAKDNDARLSFNNPKLKSFVVSNIGVKELAISGAAIDEFRLVERALTKLDISSTSIMNLRHDGEYSILDLTNTPALTSITLNNVGGKSPISKIEVAPSNISSLSLSNMPALQTIVEWQTALSANFTIHTIYIENCPSIVFDENTLRYHTDKITLKNLSIPNLALTKAALSKGSLILENVVFDKLDLHNASLASLAISGGKDISAITFVAKDTTGRTVLLPESIENLSISGAAVKTIHLDNAKKLHILALENVKQLSEIFVSGAQLSSVGAVKISMPSGSESTKVSLALQNCGISNLNSFDFSWHYFGAVDLSCNKLESFDISPLTNAASVTLEGNKINDIQGSSSALRILNVANNQLSSIGEICKNKNLTSLNISGNFYVADILPLRNLKSLKELYATDIILWFSSSTPDLYGLSAVMPTLRVLSVGSFSNFSYESATELKNIFSQTPTALEELHVYEPRSSAKLFETYDPSYAHFQPMTSLMTYYYNFSKAYDIAQDPSVLYYDLKDGTSTIAGLLIDVPETVKRVVLLGNPASVLIGVNINVGLREESNPLTIVLDNVNLFAGYGAPLINASSPLTILVGGNCTLAGANNQICISATVLTIENATDASFASLTVYGGDGSTGSTSLVGKNGQAGIYANSITVKLSALTVYGGTGGQGGQGSNTSIHGGNGGNGGVGLVANNATFIDTACKFYGGEGGQGGQGGKPSGLPDTPDKREKHNESGTTGYTGHEGLKGFDGGKGGNGGNSGLAFCVYESVTQENATLFFYEGNSGAGGQGGTGGTGGNGGQGGDGSDAWLFHYGSNGGNGGKGGKGGTGGKGGDGGKIMNAVSAPSDFVYDSECYFALEASEGGGQGGYGGTIGIGGPGGKAGDGNLTTYRDGYKGADGAVGDKGAVGAPRTHE